MKICAEFTDEDAALEAHKAIVDAGIPPETIDVRSPYPLPDEAIPPHRSHPMHLRQWVRLFWVIGATAGFSFIAYTQLVWPLRTAGHPLVSIPIDLIPTYECGMITGLVMTLVFLYLETRRYRQLNPAPEEDVPVEHGNIAIVVAGAAAEKAGTILQSKGAKSVVTYALLFLLFIPFLSGCAVKMRNERYVKSTEAPAIVQPAGTLSMPTLAEQSNPVVRPLGYFYPPEMRELNKKDLPPPPPAYVNLKNPIPASAQSVENGKLVYAHNCQFCHGEKGEGDGPVGKIFLPTPANLAHESAGNGPDKIKDPSKLTDGALFYYITMGPVTMPSFANRLSTKERFDLINYIRTFQKRNSK